MSYEYKRGEVNVVVCDVCGDFSWISDHHWRLMRSAGDKPLHLCPKCRPVAMWCAAHQQYHLPDVFHRQGCVDCGGLFTSVVRDQITRCPSCRRAANDQPAQVVPPKVEQPRSLVRMLLSLRASHRH